MKILVTGHRGFIGSHVAHRLEQQGHEVVRPDGVDLTQRQQVQFLPAVDVVMHFAAVNQPQAFATRPFDVLTTNILSTQYLIERYQGNVKRFVLASTSEVYAGSRDYFSVPMPTPESVPLCIDNPQDPRSCYGGSKLTNELQIQAMHHQTGTDFTVVRYHNIYGPGQRNQFIPDFIARVVEKQDTTLMTGDSTRTYLYIDDAVQATIDIVQSDDCCNQTINIGGVQSYTIREVAQTILRTLGSDLELQEITGGVAKHRQGDVSLAQHLFNFHPTVSLEEGIGRVVAKYFDKSQ